MAAPASLHPGLNPGRLRKSAILSIAANIFELAAGIVMVLLVFGMLGGRFERAIAKFTALMCFAVVGYGSLSDIFSALQSLSAARHEEELTEAYRQMEVLNREMRAQRHDFMNQLQVIYSLIELEEPKEALSYMDRLFEDLRRVSRKMRTDNPAINALLDAKHENARERGVLLEIRTHGTYSSAPGWQITRILGNLIDNALDAAEHSRNDFEPKVGISLSEDSSQWTLSVVNTGHAIADNVLKHLFSPGVTTKARGNGLGLYNVRQILKELNGTISIDNQEGHICFTAVIPRPALQLPEASSTDSSTT